MKTESAIRGAIGFFLIIVFGALLAAVLGGAFGALVATISPKLMDNLFTVGAKDGVVRYALAVGMIWGLFIGAAASGFACFLAAVIKILRVRLELKREQKGV
jgi:hypothetical protein